MSGRTLAALSYHYTNHQVTHKLLQKWCNPAPTDGSAPNLVVVAHDEKGNPYYKSAFNTQVCVLYSWTETPLDNSLF